MATQSLDATSRPADVSQQQLDDGGGTDVLNSDRVLSPSHRIDERRGSFSSRVVAQRLGDLAEQLSRRSTDVFHHFGRVARVVTLHNLENAAWILESEVVLLGP
jgi:hypothetical protein